MTFELPAAVNVTLLSLKPKIVKRSVENYKELKPHKPIIISEWSWRKLKYEKWTVQLDCITKKVKKRKIKE
jgi:hypothetical protein